MIDHLQMQALTYQLAYTLCSVVVDMRISQTVEVPNLLVSALLPLDILCVAPQPAQFVISPHHLTFGYVTTGSSCHFTFDHVTTGSL